MQPSDQPVDDLLDAILDSKELDAAAAEPARAAESPLARQLKIVAAIAEFHRGGAHHEPAHNVVLTSRSNAVDESATTWGHLRVLEWIGRGSFGEVYRAWDTALDREVALKLLPAGSGDPAASTLIDEGKLLARVRHPNVVTIYGAERIADRIGLWMEFVRGRTLEQMLREQAVLGSVDAIGIGIELCRAVAAVHAVGLLHRDIKTHNVMRADDGRIVLMDFGASREIDRDESPDLAGTPLYLAPEVLRGGRASVQSDIYSLGVLMARLVTGSYPVSGRTVGDVCRAHERGVAASVRTVGIGTPRRLARVIDRAIDPRPERRYESVEELGRALRALQPRGTMARWSAAAATAAAIMAAGALTWEVAARQAGFGLRPTALLVGRVEISPANDSVTDVETYELYLQARSLLDRRGLNNPQEAIRKFERVIDRDPQFAPGHAGLAIAYAFRSFPFRGISFEEAYPIMRREARKALDLHAMQAEAHAAMGWVYAYEHDWANAEQSFQRAIDLNPALTLAYTSYSISTLQPQEKYDEALRLLAIAERYDPHSNDVQREIGQIHFYAGRYPEAVETFQRIAGRDPEFPFVAIYLARALTLVGRTSEAFPLLEPGYPSRALAHVRSGERADAERLARQWSHHPYQSTVIAAALGETDRAIESLERTAVAEPHRIGRLLIEPELAPLREHPRVLAIRERLGLPK